MSERNILGSQRARDILTCRICSQYLREPRQLPCGHSFCLQCLEHYYTVECQRSDTGRLRSPSVERRRRGLLPCPAAPLCLHVAVVPDDGVAGFPVNQKIADIKEHVVNEMAYNISKRIGRPHSARADSDTASVRSDETDFSDISCETTRSAPADLPDGKSSYPNLAKYAKYFESERDGSSSNKYSANLRSERRRVAISSSFQHRRRRVQTPSPTAFDDSTRDSAPQRPSRCGSAPHLDSDGGSYRPTLRPRQGSSIASPLLRRARPASSCIPEELVDDQEFSSRVGEKTTLNETPRRAPSTEQRRQPLFHDHVILPTHRENISANEDRRSMPADNESTRHGRNRSEDVKTRNTSSKTAARQDEPPRHSKQHSEKLGTCNSPVNTMQMPARGEPARYDKHHSEYSKNGGTSSNAVPVSSEPNTHGKHISHNLETKTSGTSGNVTATRAEAARNSKSQPDDVKTSKTSTSGPSRPRRVLPNVPTDCGPAESLSERSGRGDDIHPQTAASNIHQANQARLSRTDKLTSTDRHCTSSLSQGQKDPKLSKSSHSNTSDANKPKSSTASVSDASKSRSSATSFTDREQQKTHNSRLPTSIKTDSVETKPSASAKLHGVDHSESSVPRSKSSSKDSVVFQKSQDSGRLSGDFNTSQSKSAAASSKVHGAERVKSSQHSGQTTSNSHGSVSSKSVRKDGPSPAGNEQKGKQSDCSTANKSRPSKSTPGSGSRLTYKVNAATIQPVLMNSRKMKQNSPKTEDRSSFETATDAGENPKCSEETMPSEDAEMQEESNYSTASTQHSNNVQQSSASTTSATSNVNLHNSLNENDRHFVSSGVEKDSDRGAVDDAGMSVPRSPQSLQSDVSSERDDRSGANTCHTDDCLPRQRRSETDDKTPAAGDADAAGNKDAEDKKQQQWHEFMATLQAARVKYSSTDNRLPLSETSRPQPVYSDSITPCWRIQRDDFAVPTSIAIAADGSAVIADVANCLLDFTDVDGNIVHSVTGTKPFSVAIGCKDNIYVGDRRSRTVRVFDIYGSDVAQWDAETTSLGWIAGIAALRNGQLAIVDRERCKVGIYTAGGERVTEFGSYGTKDAQLCMADFVAVDSHNRVIVTDSGNHQLKLFDPATGKLVANFASRGNTDGCLLWPKGVTVDAADRIIVADSGNDRVCQFADDGQFISNLLSATAKPYHVNCGGDSLLGVTHFALNGASRVDVFAVGSVS